MWGGGGIRHRTGCVGEFRASMIGAGEAAGGLGKGQAGKYVGFAKVHTLLSSSPFPA